jgi:glutamate/tyrosine decarboxylase-like PLP-dependent enzyme
MAENLKVLRELLNLALDKHGDWRKNVFDDESIYEASIEASPSFQEEIQHLRQSFGEFLERIQSSVPYFHPRYAAQMLKDPAITAILGYVAVMLANPNNHAYEGGPVTTEMEMEVVSDLMKLVGFDSGWGHLASGGSLANLEALWAVRDFRKPGKVVFSKGSHYSWKRICSILRIDGVEEIDVDRSYRIDLDRLETVLRKGDVMLVAANLGTTGCGSVDSLTDILALREKYGFHLHVDAAYGGYFKTTIIGEKGDVLPYDENTIPLKEFVYESLIALSEADSITIDPHKHGLVSYGAGCVIYRDERLRDVILNTAPYTYHKTDKPNLGMFSLEGSRPGASAAACWLTHKVIPLNSAGFGAIISECIRTAATFYERLSESSALIGLSRPDLDICCFFHRGDGKSLKSMNAATLNIYRELSIENPKAPFILSKFVIDRSTARRMLPSVEIDDEHFTTLRAVFMKHWMLMGKENYLDKLIDALNRLQ